MTVPTIPARPAASARATPPAGGMAGGLSSNSGATSLAPDCAAAGPTSSRVGGGISDIDLARIQHHAQAAWRRPAEFDAFERGVPEVDARFPQHAAARRIVCQQLRKRKGA